MFGDVRGISQSGISPYNHARAAIGYLILCKTYCCAIFPENSGPISCSAIRRLTTSFCCRVSQCKKINRRFEHVRAIADYIVSNQSSEYVLGNAMDDDAIVSQIASPRTETSSRRSPVKSLARLRAITQGPLPLTPEMGTAEYRDAPYHKHGWKKVLVPSSPPFCSHCNTALQWAAGPQSSTDAAKIDTEQLSVIDPTEMRWKCSPVPLPSKRVSWVVHSRGAFRVEVFRLCCPVASCWHTVNYTGVSDGYFVKNYCLICDLLTLYGLAFFMKERLSFTGYTAFINKHIRASTSGSCVISRGIMANVFESFCYCVDPSHLDHECLKCGPVGRPPKVDTCGAEGASPDRVGSPQKCCMCYL